MYALLDAPDPPPPEAPPPAAPDPDAEARGMVDACELAVELARERSSRSEMTEKGRRQMRPSDRRKAKWEGPT